MSLLCRSSCGFKVLKFSSSPELVRSFAVVVMAAVEGGFDGFSAFFALLRFVPELSASFRSWGALDDEEFFVIEGSLVALTPGVSPMCQATSRVHAN